jgi:transposase
MIIDDYPARHTIGRRYELLRPVLDERLRRLWAAAEAVAIGTGGIEILANATGLSRSTIRSGMRQLKHPDGEWLQLTGTGRARKTGGGRKSVAQKEGGIETALQMLINSREPEAFGPLAWTCKSLRRLAEELGAAGYRVSYKTVGNLLHNRGYSFAKQGEYRKWSLRDRQKCFSMIAEKATSFLKDGQPLLSLRFHVSPDATTAPPHLVVPGLLSWWRQKGLPRYSQARRLLLTVDNPMAGVAWTPAIEAFAKEIPLEVSVTYFPPGTWRWRMSIRQVTSCSIIKETENVSEISASLDLVLPSQG